VRHMDAKEDLEAPSGSRMLPSEREHDTEHEPGVARAVLDAVGLWAMLLVKLVTAVVGVVVLAAAVALFPVWACIRHTALPNLAFKLAFKVCLEKTLCGNPKASPRSSLLPFLQPHMLTSCASCTLACSWDTLFMCSRRYAPRHGLDETR
jgi:hypothetical protein